MRTAKITIRTMLIALLLGLGSAGLRPCVAQRPTASITGVVRDSAHVPLGGADVLLADRRAVTDELGNFRIDSVSPGTYPLTVRRIGFYSSRTEVTLSAGEPTRVEIILLPAPASLPTIMVEADRPGLYGIVGDTAFRPLHGARVRIMGVRGGEMRTDSLGRFSLPSVGGGDYLVRISHPGYRERRFSMSIERGRGREVTILLRPAGRGDRAPGNRELWVLRDLDQRLAVALDRHVLTREELKRYGSLSLCEIPELRAEIPSLRIGYSPVAIVDGWRSFFDACSWRADEVELVEWGGDTCRDVTGSVAELFRADCRARRTRTGDRITSRGWVLIWESW